jgi:hypothetical protein
MLDFICDLIGNMKPLEREKDPAVACLIGFFFGGVGLGIYFKSFVDFLMPIGVTLALYALNGVFGNAGWFIGAIVAGLYGYYRALTSNAKLATSSLTLGH